VADGLGVTPVVTNPALWFVVTVPVVLVVVNVVTAWPARAAARACPAVLLREG
jgi:hypothetical protein